MTPAQRSGTRAQVGAIALSACIAVACSPLSHYPGGVCGNGVLDPGEDCDGQAGTGACGAAGDGPRACHLLCEAAEDCPEGWACAPSGSCHHAVGAFVPMGVPEPAADLWALGDLDGDTRPDLVTLDVGSSNRPGEVRVSFGTGTGDLVDATTQRLPAGTARTLDVAAVDGLDALDDVVVAAPTGVVVLRGLSSRRLAPSAAQSYVVRAAQEVRLLFAHVAELWPAESPIILYAIPGTFNAPGGIEASPGGLDIDPYQNFGSSRLEGDSFAGRARRPDPRRRSRLAPRSQRRVRARVRRRGHGPDRRSRARLVR